MGNNISVGDQQSDIWWPPPSTHITELEQIGLSTTCASTQTDESEISQMVSQQTTAGTSQINEETDETHDYKKENELKLQQFKSDLDKKHLARREAIAERSREIMFLREELIKYKKENEQLKDLLKQNNESDENTFEQNIEDVKFELQQLRHENEELQNNISELNTELNRSEEICKQNNDLRKSIAETQRDLQAVNTQVLEFEKERHDYEVHVVALKDVIQVSKRLLEIRENQLRELKTKVTDIETSLAEREVSMMSQNLKDEYERQLENIRNLRAVYEQRQAATKAERDLMASQLTDAKNILESEQKKNGELQERIGELENNVSDKYDEIKSLESQLGLAKAEFRGLETEMSAINQLFSQILYGFNSCQEINFDKLIKLLEENHDLLTNIAINEESESMSHAMPKVLLDLVNQINENKCAEATETEKNSSEASSSSQSDNTTEECQQTVEPQSCVINSAEEIVTKLPKVWRVLTELLRQQSGPLPVNIEPDGADPCYKSIETPKGPKLVLSVSQTFIRLKDLILEKKSLEKEMTHLKQLNTHLETRLQDQEKRLETVSTELSKTWHVVGRMQRQHQQLHTHEKILRYELAQKRKMLTELKEELEYCREKWVQAREKNSNTEEEWKKLRSEFASRKTVVADDLNNSAESGYSDERECSSDEEYNEKRNRKLVNKIPVAEQTSDTDTEEINTTQNGETETTINSLENTIPNQNPENSTQSNVEQLETTINSLQNTITNQNPEDSTHSNVDQAETIINNLENAILNENPEDSTQSNVEQMETTINNLENTITNQNPEDCTHTIVDQTESIINRLENEIINQNPEDCTQSNEEQMETTINSLQNRITNQNPENCTHTIVDQTESIINRLENRIMNQNAEDCTQSNVEQMVTTINSLENTIMNQNSEDCTHTIVDQTESIINSLENAIMNQNPEDCTQSNVEQMETTINSLENTITNQNSEECTHIIVDQTELIINRLENAIMNQNPEDCIQSNVEQMETTINNLENTITNQNSENCLHTNVDQTETIINSLENAIRNDNPEDSTHSYVELGDSTECDETEHSTVEQKTDLAVQNQREKTVPASLDMIDNVCALGTIPVVIPDCPESQIEERPSTSSSSSVTPSEREISQDERLRKREERLKRLEEQCKQLVTKVTNTTNRSTQICNRLETLHEQYGNDSTSTRRNEQESEEPENNSE